jgi:hypothetical protein
MYKEQMLANYQIKRNESNNFGNLNIDYSRFSDNNIININQKNQQHQVYEHKSNNRNNLIPYHNTFEQLNENHDYYNDQNFQNYNQQSNNYRNIPNINTNVNLRINTINSTNRSSDFANDKSVLFSPHFNQVNNKNIMSGLAQFQQNPNYHHNENANAHLNEFNYSRDSEIEMPNRKSEIFLIFGFPKF